MSLKVHLIERHGRKNDGSFACVLCGRPVAVSADDYELVHNARLGAYEEWCAPEHPIAEVLGVMLS